jgi:hypothetical protein
MKLSDRHNDEGYNYYAKMKLKYWISIEVKKKPMQNMIRKRFKSGVKHHQTNIMYVLKINKICKEQFLLEFYMYVRCFGEPDQINYFYFSFLFF